MGQTKKDAVQSIWARQFQQARSVQRAMSFNMGTWWRWAWSAGGACLCLPSAWAQAQWHIVVPWHPPQVSVNVPQLFERELQQRLPMPVAVRQEVYNQQDASLAWSLSVAPTQPSLVLFSEELALLGERDRAHPRHMAHYVPVMLIWQTRWCLFVAKDSPLQRSRSLDAWMRDPEHMPEIAIPEAQGRLSIWVRGMEQHTRRSWKVHAYGLRGSIVEPLESGNTVALSYCNRQRLHPNQTRIVAQSGPVRAEHMPEVPLFSELGWAPMEKGWMAWMVPKAVPVQQRERMEEALAQVMLEPRVQAQLRITGHVVQPLTAKKTQAILQSVTQSWTDIHTLLP